MGTSARELSFTVVERDGRRFEAELRDQVLGRRLTCAYDVRVAGR
ncbi:MAG TPA: hypothetical protein VGL23_16660 [Chloroflexota bacterium]